MSKPIPFSLTYRFVPHKSFLGISDGFLLQTLFDYSCQYAQWAAKIDQQFNALISCNTWAYIRSDKDYPSVPLKYTFRAKKIEDLGKEFLLKARGV